MVQTALDDDVETSEVEFHATNLWQDLQQATEQDCLLEGQKQIETIHIQSQNGTIETRAANDFRLRRPVSGAVFRRDS